MKKNYFLFIALLITAVTFAQPTNDNCANAELIAVSSTNTNIVFDINTTTIQNETICTTTADFADVWYQFSMPYNGNIYINGTINWNNFALYSSCGGTEIQCSTTNGLFTNLTSGTTYFLRVYRNTSTASNTSYQSFKIQAFEETSNDDCASAENITVTTAESTVNFNIGGATVNNEEGCAGTTAEEYVDVWYNINMPVNGNLYINGTYNWNKFALYDSCGGTEIQCISANGLFTGLTSGTNYKLRLFRTRANAENTQLSFKIQAFEAPANDDCASAENITVTTTESTVNFNIGGATVNNEEGCTGTTAEEYVDIWYNINMPVNGNLYINGTYNWNKFALYNSCGGTEIQCVSANGLFTGLTAATNYKLRLFRTRANAENTPLSFKIQAFEAPTNDDCASAENITVTTAESTVNFNIGGATVNNEEGCAGTTAEEYVDIWYNINMPVNGNLYINGTYNWNKFALYDSCGGTEIQCVSANGLFTGLTAGTNYKLRLFRTRADAENSHLNFKIQAFEIITNDDCASAENITITNTPTTINFGIGGAAINNEVGCAGTTAEDYADIWYNFTMPIDGYIIIDGTIAWNKFAIYDACSGNQINCFENEGSTPNLTSGTTYKLRVFRTLAQADNNSYKSFSIHSTSTLSTQNVSVENSTSIYPNPADTELNISMSDNQSITSVELYTILGKKIMSTNNKKIDISNLNPGLYLVRIKTSQGQTSKKIVIQ
ncbi:T9SS type A sorting domain-containing protein [Algibacter pacificus]|uniref:T9SS type A sorting domain-containing protein n=1 Tax=Algibacter pacificus TaxID=2599389 RepID=UPI0011CB092D|nr:T9SS type A sorting domain-containing protein [Algibacter pacificus]